MSQRRTRVEHGLRDVLQHMITNDVRDPRVRAAALVTIAKVECNVDMSVAKIYVSVVGDDADADGVVEGLQKAAGFLRGPVGRELNMQRAPELRFFHDVSLDVSAKLAAIVRDDEDRARAAGRIPEAATPVVPAPERLPLAAAPAPAADAPASAEVTASDAADASDASDAAEASAPPTPERT